MERTRSVYVLFNMYLQKFPEITYYREGGRKIYTCIQCIIIIIIQTIIPVKGSVGDLISEAMEDFDADDTDQQSSEQ